MEGRGTADQLLAWDDVETLYAQADLSSRLSADSPSARCGGLAREAFVPVQPSGETTLREPSKAGSAAPP